MGLRQRKQTQSGLLLVRSAFTSLSFIRITTIIYVVVKPFYAFASSGLFLINIQFLQNIVLYLVLKNQLESFKETSKEIYRVP